MPTEGPGFFYTLLVFLPALTLLVFIHELGHFWMARRFGIRVEKFSIGFGKAIWQRTDKHGTRWQIASIPLGGYVQFFGDDNAASAPGKENSGLSDREKSFCYHYKPVWQRSLVAAAGPVANFLLAIVIYTGLFLSYGETYQAPIVGDVVEDSPAAAAGIRAGDRILSVNGIEIDKFTEMRPILMLEAERPVELVLDQGGARVELSVVLDKLAMQDRFGNTHYRGVLGVYPPQEYEVIDHGLFGAVGAGWSKMKADVRMMFTTIKQIVMGYRSLTEMGGPVRMASVVGEVAQMGIVPFLGMLALISVNLGFVNLLPIPALDGGHLALYAVEAVNRGPLNEKAIQWVYGAGALFVMSLMAFMILNDIYMMTGPGTSTG